MNAPSIPDRRVATHKAKMAPKSGKERPDTDKAVALKAAKSGDAGTIKSLVSRKVDLPYGEIFDAALTDFRTVSRKQEHLEILKLIYDCGLRYDTRIGWMNQPLLCACAMYGNAEIIDYVVSGGKISDPFCNISIGNLEGVRKTAESGHALLARSDINGFNWMHYCAASSLGRRDGSKKESLHSIFGLLIEAGADPRLSVHNRLNLDPLLLCAWFGGDADILVRLVGLGAKPDGNDNKALEFALEPHQRSGEPYYHIAEALLESGAEIDLRTSLKGRTLLHGAAHRGSILPVRWLIGRKADVNARTIDGKTPLHLAAERNTEIEVAKMLVENGCDWKAKDKRGMTALQYAIGKNRTKVIGYLKSL